MRRRLGSPCSAASSDRTLALTLSLAVALAACSRYAPPEQPTDGGLETDARADAPPLVCSADLRCDTTCCTAGQVCEGAECHLDCAGHGPRCGSGADEVCCSEGEVCYLGACTIPGAECGSSGGGGGIACAPVAISSCPPAEYCDSSIGRCMPRSATAACEFAPEPEDFDPIVEWEWTSAPTDRPGSVQVVGTPAVADLDGDCKPEIVFHTFDFASAPDPVDALSHGVLRAIHGDGSGLVFTIPRPFETDATSGIAIGDVDRDDRPDIVTCTGDERLVAFEADGTIKWMATDPAIRCHALAGSAPALADLDQDGWVEVLAQYVAVNGEDGSVQWIGRGASEPPLRGFAAPEDAVTAADLNGDGFLDMVGGAVAFSGRDGSLLFEARFAADGYPAVADLDLDGAPELLSVRFDTPRMYASRADGSYFWGPVDLNAGRHCDAETYGGGPPIVADVDGDGGPDVAVVGSCGLVVFRGRDGGLLWSAETADRSIGSTGSSVFDFEGDGRAEVVYADERSLRIFGRDGTVLYELCNTTPTWVEYPVVADVDADDHAEIVVVSSAWPDRTCADGSTQTHGIRVIGDRRGNWVRTRRVWNQYSYHVTNVAEDGTVPLRETANWSVPGLNNFRQNVYAEGVLAAPDLAAVDLRADYARCSAVLRLEVRVLNRGAAGVPAGVAVAFYRSVASGPPELLGVARTSRVLLPGESELVAFDWMAERVVLEETSRAWAIVDHDAGGGSAVHECDEENASVEIAIRCRTVD